MATMNRKILIVIGTGTPYQRKRITRFLKEQKCEWWHWIPDFWIVSDPKKRLTAAAIRDGLEQVVPSIQKKMVIEINGPADWAASGPRKMFEWLEGNWD